LIDVLGRLGEYAQKEGVELLLEPLNRYEDYLVNTLAQAAGLIADVGSPAVRIVADTYHMNIEEADPAAALLAVAPYIGHLQASDSNRLEPGAGHIDWALFGATVTALGYDRSIAVESRLSGDAADVLPTVPTLLRRYL
jgi:sugar phosphate isomerase/epimerase